MELQRGFRVLVVLFLVLLGCVVARDVTTYFNVGGNLELKPVSVSESITTILWKQNGNLVADWSKEHDSLEFYGNFTGRATLDLTTGRLDIKNTRESDAGSFTVEINNKVQDVRLIATSIKVVPEPELWLQPLACGATSEACSLTCGDDTTGATPVTYRWRWDDGEWSEGEQMMEFTKDETRKVKAFTCLIKNPVSEKVSQPKDNPFYHEDVPVDSVKVGLGVGIPLLLLAIAGVIFWKKDTIKAKFSGAGGQDAIDPAPRNGNGAEFKPLKTDVSPDPKPAPAPESL